MNFDTYTVIKNARIAIERAEEMKKLVRIDLEKQNKIKKINNTNMMNENESREMNPIIWKAIDEINYKLSYIIDKLNLS